MSINTMEYAAVFMQELDSQMVECATSGWMEDNAGQVQYSGGAEVKIPKMELSGLGNYDRDKGFATGSVTVNYETKKLTQDRGRAFQVDAMDVDETNFAAVAGNVMGEFQRTKVIPEIDAYRYSTIAQLAETKGGKQMSDAWIDARLDSAVGKERADEIREAMLDDNVGCYVVRVGVGDDVNTPVIFEKLDDNANVVSKGESFSAS